MVVPQFEAQWPRTTATEQVGDTNGTCSLQSNAKSDLFQNPVQTLEE